jgi:DNA-binding LytR/AlgR family response regulator
MRCLIVDDEEMSRRIMVNLCEQIDELKIVGACHSAMEAIQVLKNDVVDLLFLDIEMPGMTGMEMVRTVENLPQVVFTTSKTEYALEAFEHNVTDYIHKPVQPARLMKSVERALSLHTKKHVIHHDEIYVKADGRLLRLNLNEIVYIESLGDYVVFHNERKEKFIVHSTLKNIDEKITHPRFLKVHRSFIVNLSKIVDIQETNLAVKDKVIPISRAHKPVLMNHINAL